MDSATKPIEPGFRTTVTPYLCVKGGARALEFYRKAFGATEVVRLIDSSGRVSHAEFKIGEASIFLADEFPEINVLSPESIGGSPVLIVVDVADVDALFNQALAAGAVVERPLEDGFDGALRTCKLIDPFGHHWMFTTSKPERLRAELHTRAAV